MYIAKAVQTGRDVLIYDKDGATLFAVRGQLMEFAPRWVAIKRGNVVQAYNRNNLLTSTIPEDGWNKGLRP